MATPSTFRMVCPFCPSVGEGMPAVLHFTIEDIEARCPHCRRWYGVLSREIVAPTRQTPAGSEDVNYTLMVKEPDGRTRPRRFVGPRGLQIKVSEHVTIASWRGKVVGIMLQEQGLWEPTLKTQKRTPYDGAWAAVWALGGLLGLWIAWSALGDLAQAVQSGGVMSIVVLVLCALVLAVPFLRWVLRG